MRELDDRLDPLRKRKDLTVAVGPMATASGARMGCSDESSPEDYEDVEPEDSPGELIECDALQLDSQQRNCGSDYRQRHECEVVTDINTCTEFRNQIPSAGGCPQGVVPTRYLARSLGWKRARTAVFMENSGPVCICGVAGDGQLPARLRWAGSL